MKQTPFDTSGLAPGLFIVGNFGCNKDDDENNEFIVEVIGKGLDCGDTFLIQFKEEDKNRVRKYHNNTNAYYPVYYVNNLIEEHKVTGLKLRVSLETCLVNNFPLCTTFGPGYTNLCIKISEIVN